MAELDGDRAAAMDWGCGGVWELHETRAVLKAGSAWAERLRRCGATVSFELAGVRAGGGDVLGFLGRERARQEGENETGLLLVLRHVRVGELRLCSELSTATARWRPRSSSGWRGEGSKAPARGEVGPGGRWGTAWGGGRSRRWPAASSAAGGAELCRWQRSRKGGRRKMKGGSICKFRKFQGPYCKSTITFKLGLN